MRNRKGECRDCNVSTFETGEYYMVNDDVWAQAGMGPRDGLLCITDLESRLGRPLKIEDFSAAPINEMFFGTVGVDRFL